MFGVDRFAPGPQPSGRTPAPGRLGLVQAFVNTFWDLDGGGADVWPDAAAFGRWLDVRGFGAPGAGEPSAANLARAIALREALRGLARANQGAAEHAAPAEDAPAAADPAVHLAVLDDIAARAPLRLRFTAAPAAPATHEPAPGLGAADAACALVLGVVAEAMADGSWSRLKACPGPHCGWLFYDGSRNRSRHWCSMQLCGNRVKGREFRARRRSGPDRIA
jgi:predicted RNA-binding Zn ribbon-like protein